jgi:hypothetical protein
VFFQPGRQVGRPAEIKQRHSFGEDCVYGQGLQLLQWQGLDFGGGGLAEGAADAVEQASGITRPSHPIPLNSMVPSGNS